jgi:predicted GNAT family acetyltransferase
LKLTTTDNGTRSAARETVGTVLAASCACQPGDLLGCDVVFTRAHEVPGRLRFPLNEILILTTGNGVVVSSSETWESWLRFAVGHLSRDAIFSPMTIADLVRQLGPSGLELRGPYLNYACSADSFQETVIPEHVEITCFEGHDVERLYEYRGFEHALSYQTDAEPPDVLAAAAFHAGELIGVAAVSADSDELWQVGVHVAAGARNTGVGSAVVSHVTRQVLDSGRVPYYATRASNLHSVALALDLGYWPAWTHLHSSVER